MTKHHLQGNNTHNRDMQISAIIPAYNAENYIADAITSVLSQSYPAFEIIIVDDGSEDNIGDVINSYGKEIKYFYQKNKGPGSARNTGAKIATGSHLAFLYSDDVWEQDHLQNAVTVFLNNGEIEWYCAANYKINSEKNKIDKRIYKGQYLNNNTITNFFSAQLESGFTIPHPDTFIVNKNLFLRTKGFEENFKRSEDRLYWFKLALYRQQLGYSTVCGAKYKTRKGSLVAQSHLLKPVEFIEYLINETEKVKGTVIYEQASQLIDKLLNQKCLEMIYHFEKKKLDQLVFLYGYRISNWKKMVYKLSVKNRIHRKIFFYFYPEW